MLKTTISLLFFLVSVASAETITADKFSCERARAKKGKTCDFFICKSPDGIGLGRKIENKKGPANFSVFPLNTNSKQPYLETPRVGVFRSDGTLYSEIASSQTPNSVLPADVKDDFISYLNLSAQGAVNYRDELISENCEDAEIAKITEALNKQKDHVAESLVNRDYVKVVEAVEEMNVMSRMVPRDSVPAGYCELGNSTFASPEAQKRIEKSSFKEPEGKVLTEQEAQSAFDEIKAMKDLPWEYTWEGCFARAQTAADRLQKKGIATGKAWYFGDGLWPNNLEKPADGGWSYHVAPFVYVKGKDGKVRKMVLDPASQSGPVESYEFGKTLTTRKDPQIITTRWAGGPSLKGFPHIQMIYTNNDYFNPTDTNPLSQKALNEKADAANSYYLKELEKQRTKDLLDLTK